MQTIFLVSFFSLFYVLGATVHLLAIKDECINHKKHFVFRYRRFWACIWPVITIGYIFFCCVNLIKGFKKAWSDDDEC